mgnify:CR=1 FL=1
MTLLRTLAAAAAFTALAGCANIGSPLGAYNGLQVLRSPYGAAETLARLETQVKQRGLAVVAQLDHAAAAQRAGRTLRPTALLIFGNPQAGTPLMECVQTIGIDLPMKALVWTDVQQQTWLAWNDPAWLVKRHSAAECPAAETLGKALADIAAATVAK